MEIKKYLKRAVHSLPYIRTIKRHANLLELLAASLQQEVDTLKQQLGSRQLENASLQQQVDAKQHEIAMLQQQVDTKQYETALLQQQVDALSVQAGSLQEQVSLQGLFPAGHFYSPIPTQAEIAEYLSSRFSPAPKLPEININREKQVNLLEEYQSYYNEITFPKDEVPDFRYFYNNEMFAYTDAFFLHCYLRKNQPGRIVEVGSGFSSAVILDTIDRFFHHQPEITFIDPYPERLLKILKPQDKEKVNILEAKAQNVDISIFTSLKTGDFLFIDSSHVFKCGSDLQFILFNVIPLLGPGITVHFHDIFYPFEYPSHWLTQGRYWNELYFLRAFLAYNHRWEICFFNSYLSKTCTDFIEAHMPLCQNKQGGSLYICSVADSNR